MSLLRPYAAAVGAVITRDFRIFLTYRVTVVTQILQTLFSVTLFYYISRLVKLGGFDTPDDYYAFVVVGLALVQLLAATLGVLPSALRQELVAGTFERIVLSPLGALGGIASMMIFPLLSSLFSMVLTIVFAVAIFGMPVEWSTVWLSVPIAALVVLAFTPFGLLIAAVVVATKQNVTGTNMIIALLSLIGGFYFPVTLLPNAIEWMSEVQPFTPALDLFRHVIVDTPLRESAWISVSKLVGSAVVITAIAIAAMQIGRAHV